MKLLTAPKTKDEPTDVIETILVTRAQLQDLEKVTHDINPDMPVAFGGAQVIRTLLERIEESGIDLTAASDEEEITRIATHGLRRRDPDPDRTRG